MRCLVRVLSEVLCRLESCSTPFTHGTLRGCLSSVITHFLFYPVVAFIAWPGNVNFPPLAFSEPFRSLSHRSSTPGPYNFFKYSVV